MSSLENPFLKEEHYNGSLKAGDIVVGQARVDIQHTEFDTNNIAVKISDIKWAKLSTEQMNQCKGIALDFVHQESDHGILLKLDEDFSIPFDEATCGAQLFEKWFRYEQPPGSEDKATKPAHVTYIFPLVGLTRYRGGSTFQDSRGLYRGYRLPDKEDLIKWGNNEFSVKSALSDFTIYDSMIHEEIDDDEYHSIVIGRRSKLYFDINQEDKTPEEIKAEAREIARVAFMCISLLEGNAIDWQIEELYLRDKSDGKNTERKTFRWAIAPNKNQPRFARTVGKRKMSREYIATLVDAYCTLSIDGRKVFDRVFRAYQLACIAQVIEVELIYWHSCLDLLRKQLGYGRNPFSEKLRSACETNGISFDDLDLLMGKDDPTKFRFTEIRNQYLHEGFLVEDYNELISEMRKMKALTERLMLHLLKLDYRQSPVGILFP